MEERTVFSVLIEHLLGQNLTTDQEFYDYLDNMLTNNSEAFTLEIKNTYCPSCESGGTSDYSVANALITSTYLESVKVNCCINFIFTSDIAGDLNRVISLNQSCCNEFPVYIKNFIKKLEETFDRANPVHQIAIGLNVSQTPPTMAYQLFFQRGLIEVNEILQNTGLKYLLSAIESLTPSRQFIFLAYILNKGINIVCDKLESGTNIAVYRSLQRLIK